jgi:hypothetical protein
VYASLDPKADGPQHFGGSGPVRARRRTPCIVVLHCSDTLASPLLCVQRQHVVGEGQGRNPGMFAPTGEQLPVAEMLTM